ncbi:MAG: PGN_0703 family putative restriction endonuclease [bacterium]
MNEIYDQLWDYAERENLLALLDRDSRGDATRPPVFQKQHSDCNILLPSSANAMTRKKIVGVLARRHRWFRSMKSSQALAQSAFANLVVAGQFDALNNLPTDQGLPAFGMDLGRASAQLEYEVGFLNEPMPTSVDVLISGARRVAVECKFTESSFGQCSRPGMRPEKKNYQRDHCDGSYTRQRGREDRCSLSERGIAYWRHAPRLFRWKNDRDYESCPLRFTYQIARNLLAACVGADGAADIESAHALVIYDHRNPAFQRGGDACDQFRSARDALRDSSLLRSCSWQALTAALADNPPTEWLARQLARKYGF